ncbi:MAG: MFS transporter [Anaerolineaceae bacterium]|nr:MFS transporter [Anaerolineaceae bacterium]
MEKNQVPWLERISYGLSNTGFNLMFMMTSTYLLYFYTDVFGVAAGIIAPVFLVGRFLDAITDPLEGILMDRVNTRWGKIRPFWLWFSLPWGILATLVFTGPDLSATAKVVFIYVTYLLFNAVISMVSLPMAAILPSLTSNTHERTVVSVIAQVFGTFGGLFVMMLTLPLVSALGGTNPKQGFLLTAILFSSIAVLLFLNAWARTRERVLPINKKPVPVRQALKSLNQGPWYLLMAVLIIVNLVSTMRNQSTIYFMQYNVGRPELTSAMLTIPNLFMIISLVFSPLISKKIGKRNAGVLGFGVSVLGSLLVVVAGSNVPLLFAGSIVLTLGIGLPFGVIAAMFADTVDYIEWKSGVRSTGLVYSASTISIKMGQGMGGALGASVLALGHYVPNVIQSASSLTAIQFNFSWAALIGVTVGGVVLIFYQVDKLYPTIQADLTARREAAALRNQEQENSTASSTTPAQ